MSAHGPTTTTTATTAGGLLALDLEKTREVYDLSSMLSNTWVYLGVTAAMLVAFVVLNAWPKLASCLVPRWFNKSLPLAWITGWASPTREQTVDALLRSDFEGEGRVGEIQESARESALREPPAACDGTVVSAFTGRKCCCGGFLCRPCRWVSTTKYGFFSWIWVPWTTSEKEYVERVGLDGYLLFRTMRLVLLMTGILTVVALFGIAPAYASLSHPCPAMAGTEAAAHGANAWIWGDTASCNTSYVYANNVTCTCGFFATVGLDVGSQFYLHEIIGTFVGLFFTATQLWLLAGEARHWMRVRLAYALSAPPEIYTVMLRYVPRPLRSEVRLRQKLEDMFPGEVHSVTLTPGPAARLGQMVQRLEDLDRKISREQSINETYRKMEEQTKVPCVHCRAPEKSMALLQAEHKRLTAQLKARRDKYTAACALHIQQELQEADSKITVGRGRSRRRKNKASSEKKKKKSNGDDDGDGNGNGSGNNGGSDDDDFDESDFDETLDALYWEWTERKRQELSQAAAHTNSRDGDDDNNNDTQLTKDGEGSTTTTTTTTDDVTLKEIVAARGIDDFEEDHAKLYGNVAFVTFRTATSAARVLKQGRNAPEFPRDSYMKMQAARQPRDVRWGELVTHKARWEKVVDVFVSLMFVVILIIWGFVVFMIGLYTTPDALGCMLSPNCTDEGDPTVTPFWASVLSFISPLFLQGLSAFVKQIIDLLVNTRFVPYKSQVDQHLFVLFWVFQATQNFLLYTISATLMLDFYVYFEHPMNLISALGESIPAGATFYILFIETELLFTLVFGMFRVAWFTGTALHVAFCGCVMPLRRMVYSPALCGSCGAPSTPSSSSPSGPLIRVLFIFLLVNSYALIQPLITLVGMIYAVTSLVLYTHEMLSVATTRFDSGGIYWKDIYGIFIAIIMLPQFIMLCVVALSDQAWLIALQVLAMIGTVVTAFAIYNKYNSAATKFPDAVLSVIDDHVASNMKLARFSDVRRQQRDKTAEGGLSSSSSSPPPSSTAAIALRSSAQKRAVHIAKALSTRDLDAQPILPMDGETDNAAQSPSQLMAPLVDSTGDAEHRDLELGEQQQQRQQQKAQSGKRVPRRMVIIPPNVWRKNKLINEYVGDRSYIVPATGQDIMYANRPLLKALRAYLDGGDGSGGAAAAAQRQQEKRRELLAAAFAYDYHHPVLRGARNLTSRFTERARMQDRERAAAMMIQSVFRGKMLKHAKKVRSGGLSSKGKGNTGSNAAAAQDGTYGVL